MKVAIIGAAELGKLIAYHATEDSGYEIAGYFDDYFTGAVFNNYPVLGTVNDVLNSYENKVFDKLIVAIGYNHMDSRVDIFSRFKNIIPYANIIHSSCYIDKSCKLGEGIFLLPRVVLDMDVVVEDNVLMNTGVVVAHHTKIQSHTFIGPAVHIAGLVNVGQGCFLGIGCTVIDCVEIAANSTIGAGAVVTKNTQPNSVSVGVPAKVIKYKK